jgi:hypothetical protein
MINFESQENEIPEIDVSKLDNISSIVTTYESHKDLMTRNVINFLFDKKSDYVFLDIWSFVNGKVDKEALFGFDKEKVISTCKNVLSYFQEKV